MNASYEAVLKQFLVKNILLPIELTEIINSYCFYEPIVWFIKTTKKQINNEIHSSNKTRTTDDTDFHWIFCNCKKLYMQAVNCGICGKFINVSSSTLWEIIPNCIVCNHTMYYDNNYDDDDDADDFNLPDLLVG